MCGLDIVASTFTHSDFGTGRTKAYVMIYPFVRSGRLRIVANMCVSPGSETMEGTNIITIKQHPGIHVVDSRGVGGYSSSTTTGTNTPRRI